MAAAGGRRGGGGRGGWPVRVRVGGMESLPCEPRLRGAAGNWRGRLQQGDGGAAQGDR
eukprot:CAMPEP_0117680778 /NCGR_PEP_ID=MMETSP0804-20121206/18564_1 /TAXON_ID=1074897 /ORGANISM="Tetraselmis astigmatica, Strain CCMP880" /LENGTH=57 /DNA_ID=CAMNT_0005490359 /DNA_START=272 /DNA_END=441 /DNA_ORIENTATION=+